MREFWLVDHSSTFGGGQRNVLNLARFVEGSLPDRRAVVVCPAESELGRSCQMLGVSTMDATFPDLGARTMFKLPRAVLHLRRVLERTPDDAIVVTFSLRALTYVHAATIGLRRRLSIVPLMPEQDSAERLTAHWLLPRFGAVVVIGDSAARAYRERIPGAHIQGINNFLPSEEVVAARRTPRPQLDGGRRTIGVLARLIPEKGIVELVEELAADPDCWETLLVGGDAQDEAYTAALVRQVTELRIEKRVRLIGRVDALDRFFADIDVLVVPSIGNEGQPTVIIEALAHGRPVIVRESIWSEAFVGLPVHPYRGPDGLSAALAGLRGDMVSREALVERFTPKHAIDAIERAASQQPSRRS